MNSSEIKQLKSLLDFKIKNSSNVFIIGHNSPDFDSIGSCIGLYALAKSHNKTAYIIVDDRDDLIEPGVRKIIENSKQNVKYIKKRDFLRLKNNQSLVIVTDVNKKNMISIGDSLDNKNDIIVIDHHTQDNNTIDTPYKFISTNVSSASEIVSRVLWISHIKYSKNVANYLLAGISLDTHRFKQNTTSRTHDVAEKLIDKGADIDFVNNLFLEEFESFCRISNLIINGTIIKKYSESLLSPIQVSFTLNRNAPNSIYIKEDYAKAADRMMKFNGVDASFALGYVPDGAIHISARGGKRVNVGSIMEAMNGGGNRQSAGGRIEGIPIDKVEEELMLKVPIGISDEENVYDEPPIIKKKQVKRFRKLKKSKNL